MNAHVYRWTLRAEIGLALELRVTAPSVVVARREIHRFLVDHDGSSWIVECVSREATRAPHALLALPPASRMFPG